MLTTREHLIAPVFLSLNLCIKCFGLNYLRVWTNDLGTLTTVLIFLSFTLCTAHILKRAQLYSTFI